MSSAVKARRWVDAGLVDLSFYSALRGRAFASEQEAALDLVEHGMEERLSPHPLLDVLTLPGDVRRDYRQGKAKAVLEALAGAPAGPLVSQADPGPAVAHLREVAARIGAGTPLSAGRAPDAPTPGRTSVVVAAETRGVLRSVASVLRNPDGDTEVVVVDAGLEPAVVLGLHTAVCARLDRPPQDVDGTWLWDVAGVRVRVAGSDAVVSGDVVLHLADGAEVRRGWATEIRSLLERPEVNAVQPLLLDVDDLVLAAGVAADGGLLLHGHPPEDAAWLDGAAVGAHPAALAHRAGEFPGGEAVLAATSRVSVRPADGYVRAAAFEPPSREGLRWSLRIPSPPGGFGDTWGDTYFAESLAAALRRQGQEVVTRRHGAHDRGPVELDDVALALRGLHPIPPAPGVRNVLWVISHPDEVDPSELEGYGVVCAASAAWSDQLSRQTGREVVPLLQASDFTVPEGVPAPREPTLVFVGTNLGARERPLVWAAVESGVPLAVHGPGWHDLPDGLWRGDHVPNAELPVLYRRHGIVLADHWPDMARHGFVANRVLDALASGARVISDEVAGLHDVVDPHDVAVATTPEQVRSAYDALRVRSGTPLRSGTWSFDDRAAQLLRLVEAL